jgi:glycosyltransferase involved in cell wall biosynthesis
MSATRKPRIFFLSFYPPAPTMGGAMAYYRHFLERNDVELFVATDDRRVLDYHLACPVLVFEQPKWLGRLCKTRLFRWAHSFRHLFAGYFVPEVVLKAAEKFRPDIIFTIGGSWGWTAQLSKVIARRLGVALVGSFNDWFDFGIIIHPLLKSLLEKKFRSFYCDCDLALCTSDGMREELGGHRNAHTLYPIGAVRVGNQSTFYPFRGEHPFRVFFGGNLGEWYGRMIEELVKVTMQSETPVDFRIYGSNQSWSKEFDRKARELGIFIGLVPFEQLALAAAESNCLLLPMGFGEENALTERTSFKTKFLDYLSYRKPILVWGPEYCSAVRVAREFDSAEICTNPDPVAALTALLELSSNPDRQKRLVENADKMYRSRFSPEDIHQALMDKLLRLHQQCEVKEHALC